ncbi:N-acetyltransferase family protein [Shewanella algae]|uniref:N-acetyltransferase family protein n=1 Tax=Shewanella algae TaxID=38313 RepID=UPI0034D42343
MSINIRTARLSDIPAMMSLRLNVSENRLQDPGRITHACYLGYLSGRRRSWVAETDTQLLGFTCADRDDARIWALFIAQEAEGKGIGKALLQQAVDWLHAGGCSKLQLRTEPGTRAEGFYRHLGWQSLGLTEDGELHLQLIPQSHQPCG